MLVAAVVSDIVVKSFFDGPRPLSADVPALRRLRVYPSNPSFPSGHSASAAGFATGVALESPRAGLVVGPVAAAVAHSRMHVGAHWLSDVVGGVAIGVGVAALGKLLVPARTRAGSARAGGRAGRRADRPAAVARRRRRADRDEQGRRHRGDPARSARRRSPSGCPPRSCANSSPTRRWTTSCATSWRARIRRGCSSVYGGDGSVSRMAQLALEFDVPFMPLPGGTFNHFSRTAGIETVDLAIDALQAGSGIAASVGELTAGGRTTTVLNSASIGIYPEFVAERTKRKARLGKWIGGVVATWRGLRDAEPIDIVIGGRRARVWSVFASVGRNTPGQVATFQRRTLSDDVLDVRVLHARGSRAAGGRRAVVRRGDAGRAARAETAAPGIRHRAHHRDRHRDLGASPARARRRSTRTTASSSADPRSARTAGTRSRCRILPKALRVYAPAPSREQDVLDSAPGETAGRFCASTASRGFRRLSTPRFRTERASHPLRCTQDGPRGRRGGRRPRS